MNLSESRIKCSCCGEEEKAGNIKNEWVWMGDGKKLKVSFYRCKKCKKIHIVQLDDEYTGELVDEISKGIIYAYNCKKDGRQPKKKKANKFLKLNKKLKSTRKRLNKEYEGCIATICNEEIKIHVEMQEV